MVGRKTEKARLKRSMNKIQETLRSIRHWSINDQVKRINQMLQGHYAYYGMARNIRSLIKIYKSTEKYWRKMLSSRSRKGKVTWKKFQELKALFPIKRPKLFIPYTELKVYAML